MRNMISALALGAALTSPAAAEWRASSDSDGAVAYIDTDSIERRGDEVRFWREVRWAEPRAFQNGVRYDRIGAHYVADCKAMTLRSISLRAALGDKLLFSADNQDPVEKAQPGSTAETDLRSACFDQWPAPR